LRGIRKAQGSLRMAHVLWDKKGTGFTGKDGTRKAQGYLKTLIRKAEDLLVRKAHGNTVKKGPPNKKDTGSTSMKDMQGSLVRRDHGVHW
jgi:hypothetical protein